MPLGRLDLSAPPDWEALERLARVFSQRRDLPSLAVGDFMYMGRLLTQGRPPVHLYKHADTRGYLCIDDQGHAYSVSWCGVPRRPFIAACRPFGSLLAALAAASVLRESRELKDHDRT